jgi:hypothetical protein
LDLPEDPWQVWNTCVTCCNTGSAVNPQTFPFNDCYKTCKDWIDLHQLAPPDEDGEGDED